MKSNGRTRWKRDQIILIIMWKNVRMYLHWFYLISSFTKCLLWKSNSESNLYLHRRISMFVRGSIQSTLYTYSPIYCNGVRFSFSVYLDWNFIPFSNILKWYSLWMWNALKEFSSIGWVLIHSVDEFLSPGQWDGVKGTMTKIKVNRKFNSKE